MKKIKYKIIKKLYKLFKNLYIKEIKHYNNDKLIKYTINELNIAGFINTNNSYCLYKNIVELICLLSEHKESEYSIRNEVDILYKLCNFIPISYLSLKENEFTLVNNSKDVYVNNRYKHLYKMNNKIFVENAFVASPMYKLLYSNKTIINYSTDMSWKSVIFEMKNNIATGRYFDKCFIKDKDIKNQYYIPIKPIILKGTQVQISEYVYMFFIGQDNLNMIKLNRRYDINWKFTSIIKDKHIRDITIEDEHKILEEISIPTYINCYYS